MTHELTVATAAHSLISRNDGGDSRADLWFFAALIALLNLPLLAGGSVAAFAFDVDAVRSGEWWRLFTHPFVHVSWYHLLLDGAAFLLLYPSLPGGRRERLACVGASAVGSLIVALFASSLAVRHGLCGLSGIAHGMMAISALEMIAASRPVRTAQAVGIASFVTVVGKCVFELVSGEALFAPLHFGLLGTPIVACHSGGVLGAMLWAYLLSRSSPILPARQFFRRLRSDLLPIDAS